MITGPIPPEAMILLWKERMEAEEQGNPSLFLSMDNVEKVMEDMPLPEGMAAAALVEMPCTEQQPQEFLTMGLRLMEMKMIERPNWACFMSEAWVRVYHGDDMPNEGIQPGQLAAAAKAGAPDVVEAFTGVIANSKGEICSWVQKFARTQDGIVWADMDSWGLTEGDEEEKGRPGGAVLELVYEMCTGEPYPDAIDLPPGFDGEVRRR